MSQRLASVVATGTVLNGVLRLDDKAGLAADLKTIRNGGIVLTVEPSTERGLRSVKMQKYYRAVVVRRIAEAARATPDAVHAVLAARYLGEPAELFSTVTGEVYEAVRVPSTADLSPDDLWTFIESCRAFAHEAYQLAIPDPDPAWRQMQQGAA